MSNTILDFQPGKAVIFNGHGHPFEFVTKDLPAIRQGEILVRTLYTTLCGSDIHTYCGRRLEPPHVVLGHEIVGEILFIDSNHSHKDLSGEKIQAGDRITWSIFSVPEGVIPPRADMPQKSNQLFKYGHHLAEGNDVFNGGLAEYCILRANTALLKLSPDIPLKVAAAINCAHATVTGGLRIAGEISGKRVLIFGAGLLGLSCMAMCKEAKAEWIGVVDTDNNRLQWSEKFGADNAYVFANDDYLKWPQADVVFDMTGNPKAMKTGLHSLTVGGCAIWIGAVFPATPVEVDAQMIVRKLLQVRGLHNYNYADFINATAFIENNYRNYPFELLVEKEYSMEDIEEAFSFADQQKPVRVGIRIADGK